MAAINATPGHHHTAGGLLLHRLPVSLVCAHSPHYVSNVERRRQHARSAFPPLARWQTWPPGPGTFVRELTISRSRVAATPPRLFCTSFSAHKARLLVMNHPLSAFGHIRACCLTGNRCGFLVSITRQPGSAHWWPLSIPGGKPDRRELPLLVQAAGGGRLYD